ncbi:MAG: DUF1974 domain-containing protein, partial [Planctomycetes bacterium]|nr:DUF1974 domain-containing protein [Planctomycetota bacterium]
EHALYEAQQGLLGFLDNLPARPVAWGLRQIVFPFGARYRPPSDRLGSRISAALLGDSDAREDLTAHVYRPEADEPGLGALLAALEPVVASHGVMARVKSAVSGGKLAKRPGSTLLERAVEAGVIDAKDRQVVDAARLARDRVIQVDSFPPARETAATS